MKDGKHDGNHGFGRMAGYPKIPEGAFKGLGKGMDKKDVQRGYSKP